MGLMSGIEVWQRGRSFTQNRARMGSGSEVEEHVVCPQKAPQASPTNSQVEYNVKDHT